MDGLRDFDAGYAGGLHGVRGGDEKDRDCGESPHASFHRAYSS